MVGVLEMECVIRDIPGDISNYPALIAVFALSQRWSLRLCRRIADYSSCQ